MPEQYVVSHTVGLEFEFVQYEDAEVIDPLKIPVVRQEGLTSRADCDSDLQSIGHAQMVLSPKVRGAVGH